MTTRKRAKIMEDTNNIVDETTKDDSNGGDGVLDNDTTTKTEDENITLSKADYEKAIQSAEDKVRGKLSKTIKELESKVKELSPVEKTPEQIDLEKRLAALEAKEAEVAERERKSVLQEKLVNGGLDKTLADYLKADVDVDALTEIVDGMVKSRLKYNGYTPKDHTSDDKITPEEFKEMSYSQKADLQIKSPELYRRLSGKK